MPILLESVCGLRHEEYCGLDNVDINSQDDKWTVISINKAVTCAGNKKVLKSPKTKTSTREVVPHPLFYDYLQNNIDTITPHKTLHDYVNPLALTKRWRRFVKNNSLPYTPFGNLRSVYATLCAEACCIDSVVSRSMGHSGNTTKDRNYLTSSLSLLKINATMLASYIKPEAFKNQEDIFNEAEKGNMQLLLKYRNFKF